MISAARKCLECPILTRFNKFVSPVEGYETLNVVGLAKSGGVSEMEVASIAYVSTWRLFSRTLDCEPHPSFVWSTSLPGNLYLGLLATRDRHVCTETLGRHFPTLEGLQMDLLPLPLPRMFPHDAD